MLNVVAVNHGDYLGRGREYVDRLRNSLNRHLLGPFEFHVIHDVEGADGWWAKLAMFQPGRFKGRCLYLDLDTIIVGNLDHMAAYDGPFAGLSDFYHPELFASGVMMWEAGEADHIWTNWEKAGRTMFHPRGDGAWIESMMPAAERLQRLFPRQIVSFKAHCAQGIPQGARLVCFHGLPRPHMLQELMEHWG